MKHFKIIANWKMYPTVADAHIMATSIRNELEHLEEVEVILCPPAIWLTEVAMIIHQQIDHLHLGIQNVFDQAEGPFTGEISAKMASSVCQYAICGHSERIEHFREGPEFVNNKVHATLKAGLVPIVCIGEREKNSKSKDKLIGKLKQLLTGVSKKELNQVIIAYEPVWAVGGNRPDSPEDVEKIARQFKNAIDVDLSIVYGGSVDDKNARAFLDCQHLDGLLIGRASLKIKDFVHICRQAESIAKKSL